MILTTRPPHLFDQAKLQHVYTPQMFEKMRVVFVRTLSFESRGSVARIVSWIEFELKVAFYLVRHRTRPEIIVASSLSLLSILTALFFKVLNKTRVVFEIRDIWPLSAIEIGGYSPRNPLIRALGWVERLGYRKADLIVGTMPNLKAHVQCSSDSHAPVKCMPMGIGEEHLASLGEAIEPQQYDKRMAAVDDMFSEGKIIIGYAGSMGAANALDYLFEAAKLLRHDTRFRFAFVGDGNLKERYIAEYSHLPNVSIGPRLRKQEVASFLARCDLLAFSSLPGGVWKYGQSLNKLIDYMAAARPIYGIYDGFDDMISLADCGRFSQTHDIDEIARQITDLAMQPKSNLVAMGKRGYDWLLKNRRYETLGVQYETMLAELLAQKPQAAIIGHRK